MEYDFYGGKIELTDKKLIIQLQVLYGVGDARTGR